MLINYQSHQDRRSQFVTYDVVDDPQSLSKILSNISQQVFIFRGMNEAKYRMYSSAQRKWIEDEPTVKETDEKAFHLYIQQLIDKIKHDQWIIDFFNNNKIPINDMLILALLQHYAELSPLLDFTEDIYTGLFFAIEGAKEDNENELSDYISLYYIPRNKDWIRATVQAVTINGADRVSNLLASVHEPVDTQKYQQETKDLSYNTFSDLPFISLDGPSVGITTATVRILGLHVNYYITNPRLEQQYGLFIMNNSARLPLVEVMNTKEKFVNCLNINKKLIPFIIEKYLIPNGIDHDSIYGGDALNNELEQHMKALVK